MPAQKKSLRKNTKGKKATNTITPKKTLVIKGARQNNLQNVDVTLPLKKLIVFTGPSGSGKSSLAFNTIYAEGQRRYVESLSSYARQFLARMDKPDVDFISGLSPAIAIEQKTMTKNPRSTVATTTEIYDHFRLLFARIGKTISPVSNEEVTKDSPRSVAESVMNQLADKTRFYLCFPMPKHKGRKLNEELEALQQRGFFRFLAFPTAGQIKKGKTEEIIDLNDTPADKVKVPAARLMVLVDRLAAKNDEKTIARLSNSVAMSFVEGGGRCIIVPAKSQVADHINFSEHFERDGLLFAEPTPHFFSFNSPLGACPECQGFGRVSGLDQNLIFPDPSLSVRQGVIAPFRTPKWQVKQKDLIVASVTEKFPIDTPYHALSHEDKDKLWNGFGKYKGIQAFFDFLASKAYKMHFRIYHARFRGYTKCPDCEGARVKKQALYVKVAGHSIGEIASMTVKKAGQFFADLSLSEYEIAVAGRVLEEIQKRLRYLDDVGLYYLTLDRLSSTLSGGESQRINLATSLGSALVGSMYVLDEPSIGLHPRDTDRLIKILEHLRDIGNTVLVVEHDMDTILRADQVVELGPAAGRLGGKIVFQGDAKALKKDTISLTGQYLSGVKEVEIPKNRRKVRKDAQITIEGAREHNLKDITVSFPLHMITCVTGVSGSGKSTLVHDTLYAGVNKLLDYHDGSVGAHKNISGYDDLDHVEMVDQSPIGRTPRSNPVTYIKVFDAIRKLFSQTHQARLRGLKPGYFSFNVPGGRCETCEGEGVVQIEMQFLADLYLECEACKGKRYKHETLGIRYKGKNIHDVLSMTVDEAVEFFEGAVAVQKRIKVLQEIGLGYLTLGQPANTLSGGEAQRVKLAAHLARPPKEHTLYIFDEPTTGLHVDDINTLLKSFNALIAHGHSVILVEHNLDVIKCADWVIDIGPEGGDAGGNIVAEGTPEYLAKHKKSHTGHYLRPLLK